MVEGARLESVYAVFPYRGFESLSLRQLLKTIFVVPDFALDQKPNVEICNRKNRLTVAVFHVKILAVMVVYSKLLKISCGIIE